MLPTVLSALSTPSHCVVVAAGAHAVDLDAGLAGARAEEAVVVRILDGGGRGDSVVSETRLTKKRPLSGSSTTRRRSTTSPSSADSVRRRGAAAVTSIASVTWPTSRLMSITATWPTSRTTPRRTDFLKPPASTVRL